MNFQHRKRLTQVQGTSNNLGPPIVIPAQAGVQWRCDRFSPEPSEIHYTAKIANRSHWIPACAGMTSRRGFQAPFSRRDGSKALYCFTVHDHERMLLNGRDPTTGMPLLYEPA
jgi:hypothetical protein